MKGLRLKADEKQTHKTDRKRQNEKASSRQSKVHVFYTHRAPSGHRYYCNFGFNVATGAK